MVRTVTEDVFEQALGSLHRWPGNELLYRVILLMLRYMGLRVGELSNVRPEDFHDDRLYVPGRDERDGNKSKQGRDLRIPDVPRLREAIREWDAQRMDSEWWLHTRTGKQYRTEYVRVLFRRLERDVLGVRFTPHMLRHTFATEILSRDLSALAAVAQYMGHTDPAITMRMYLHVVRPLKPEDYIP